MLDLWYSHSDLARAFRYFCGIRVSVGIGGRLKSGKSSAGISGKSNSGKLSSGIVGKSNSGKSSSGMFIRSNSSFYLTATLPLNLMATSRQTLVHH